MSAQFYKAGHGAVVKGQVALRSLCSKCRFRTHQMPLFKLAMHHGVTAQVSQASRRMRHGAGVTGVTAQASRRRRHRRHGAGVTCSRDYARAGVAAHWYEPGTPRPRSRMTGIVLHRLGASRPCSTAVPTLRSNKVERKASSISIRVLWDGGDDLECRAVLSASG